jgi:SAM-dependent methyltransferase
MDEYRNANRVLWDEWVKINARSEMYALDQFKAGRSSLHQLELSELGEVRGKSLLHLQCHFGLDTLSWARLGAQVTGADFSPEGVALASALSQELNIPARFVCSDLYDLPQHLAGQFDIVYTSYGVLTWLPDLRGWAQVAAHFLKPGGVFYIAEFHPFAMVYQDDAPELRIGYPYFSSEVIACEVAGSYADRTAEMRQKVSYEWAYPLGEVVTSLIEAGLQLEFLHEFPYTVYNMFPFLEKGEDGNWYLPGKAQTIPLMFSMRANRPLV